MMKNIKLRFYNALFTWHMSRGMNANKIAKQYILKSNMCREKAEKIVDKMISIEPQLKDEL